SGESPAHGAGPPSRIVGGRGIFWAPPRRATTSVGGLELRGELLEQLLHPARLQAGHDLPGRRLAPLPLHPRGEQLGRVDRRSLHGASLAGAVVVSGGFAAPAVLLWARSRPSRPCRPCHPSRPCRPSRRRASPG